MKKKTKKLLLLTFSIITTSSVISSIIFFNEKNSRINKLKPYINNEELLSIESRIQFYDDNTFNKILNFVLNRHNYFNSSLIQYDKKYENKLKLYDFLSFQESELKIKSFFKSTYFQLEELNGLDKNFFSDLLIKKQYFNNLMKEFESEFLKIEKFINELDNDNIKLFFQKNLINLISKGTFKDNWNDINTTIKFFNQIQETKNMYFNLNNPKLNSLLSNIDNLFSANDFYDFRKKIEEHFQKIKTTVFEQKLLNNNFNFSKTKVLKNIENESNINIFKKDNLLETIDTLFLNSQLQEINIKDFLLNNSIIERKENNLRIINSLAISDKNKENFLSENNFKFDLKEVEEFQNKIENLKKNIQLFKEKFDSIEANKNSLNNNQKYYWINFLYNIKKFYNQEAFDFPDFWMLKDVIFFLENKIKIIEDIKNVKDKNESLLTIFENDINKNFIFNKHKNFAKYDLEYYSFSASINKENLMLILEKNNLLNIQMKIVDIKLDSNNLNSLKVTLEFEHKLDKTLNINKIFTLNFTNDINPILNNISDFLDDYCLIDYNKFSDFNESEFLNLENYDPFIIKPIESQKINNFFKFKIKNFYKDNDEWKIETEILYHDQIIRIKTFKLKNIPVFTTLTQNQRDKNKILAIINNDHNANKLFQNIKQINNKNHSEYFVTEIEQAFEDSYILPRLNNYQIYLHSIKEINFQESSAKVFFWYKENGKIIDQPTEEQINNNYLIIKNFRPISFLMNKSKSSFFQLHDFKNGNEFLVEDEYFQIANKIDERMFILAKSSGIVNSEKDITKFSSLNVTDFIEQQAFNKLNYFIRWNIDKNSNQKISENFENEWFVPFDSSTIIKDFSENEKVAVNKLLTNYFVYYYDIKRIEEKTLSFKIGFINKFNSKKRFTTEKEYTIHNVNNHYQQTLYPEIILNKIKYSDLIINTEEINKKDFEFWKNNLHELNKFIKLKLADKIFYKNFWIPKNNIKVHSLVINETRDLFINFSFLNFDNNILIGNNYYKIGELNYKYDIKSEWINNFTFTNENLKTFFFSFDRVKRERKIEQNYLDLKISTLNDNLLEWTFKQKYIKKSFLNNEYNINKNINLDIHFHLVEQLNSSFDNNSYILDLKIDFNKLFKEKIIYQQIKRKIKNYELIFNTEIKLDDNNNVILKLFSRNENFKIINNYNNIDFSTNSNLKFIVFSQFNSIEAKISYTSSKEEEIYQNDTNLFDYNNVWYNQFNEPILFNNKIEKILNEDEYDPNQNVNYMLHEGFLLDRNIIKKEWIENETINNIYNRSINFNKGSASILSKVNDDPNDLRFYILTNFHIEGQKDGIENISDIQRENLLKKEVNNQNKSISIYHKFLYNNLENGFKVVNRNGQQKDFFTLGINNVDSNIIWIGKNQINNSNEIAPFFDATITIIDFNKKIDDIINNQAIAFISFLNNLKEIKPVNLNFNFNASKINLSHYKNTIYSGFPLLNNVGYITHRSEQDENKIIIRTNKNYVQSWINGGNSGTNIFDTKSNLVALWNSGIAMNYSVAWNYIRENINYFGINSENQHPLDSENINSLFAQILRANLTKPNFISIPWFTNKKF
ncbi:MGA_1079 family surface serine endopeptidase [Mesomycoplasma molare]|uniref:DUF31 domain-containing protein n=1 Tax=Mesomycoplasma molare TaxID=171288 RepID=A0ABY5TTM3_9BACT|nr:hypothetical protein [Mesomycoplasma molare]UWD34008.1 hypothetical protein NX772_02775 [Mesomycoplasma molare]